MSAEVTSVTLTRLEVHTRDLLTEISAALGLPTYDGNCVWRWPCALCRTGDDGGPQTFVMYAPSAPIWLGCEVCGCKDPMAQYETVTARRLISELLDVAQGQARLISQLLQEREQRPALQVAA